MIREDGFRTLNGQQFSIAEAGSGAQLQLSCLFASYGVKLTLN